MHNEETLITEPNTLIDWIEGHIDNAGFGECYGRKDETIRHVVVVDQHHSLSEVAASMICSEPPASETPAPDGVTLLPDLLTVRRDLEATGSAAKVARKARDFVRKHIDDEVLAFYSPPFYFVQFTGRAWR